jgi:hypothetical protein
MIFRATSRVAASSTTFRLKVSQTLCGASDILAMVQMAGPTGTVGSSFIPALTGLLSPDETVLRNYFARKAVPLVNIGQKRMARGKFIFYLRVSTDKQGLSGLGLEAQREAVTRAISTVVTGRSLPSTWKGRSGA